MHFKVTTLLAVAAALKVSGLALPQDVAPVAAGVEADGSSLDGASDIIDAYLTGLNSLAAPVAAPVGAGSEVIQKDTSAASAAVVADIASDGHVGKRDACPSEPASFYSSSSNSLSVADWKDSSEFSAAALAAKAPSGFTLVPGWKNLNASATANVYQGYTSDISSYDPEICAAKCRNILGCTSFVIYFERNPSLTPNTQNCPNPPAITRVKCAWYGIPLVKTQALEIGQWRSKFWVAAAGSNAYSNQPATPSGFAPTFVAGDKTVGKLPTGDTSYSGVQVIPNSPYSPQACADACVYRTGYNQRHPNELAPCNFFVAYLVYQDGKNPQMTCTYFTKPWNTTFAANGGQTRDGHVYTNKNVVGYTIGSYTGPV